MVAAISQRGRQAGSRPRSAAASRGTGPAPVAQAMPQSTQQQQAEPDEPAQPQAGPRRRRRRGPASAETIWAGIVGTGRAAVVRSVPTRSTVDVVKLPSAAANVDPAAVRSCRPTVAVPVVPCPAGEPERLGAHPGDERGRRSQQRPAAAGQPRSSDPRSGRLRRTGGRARPGPAGGPVAGCAAGPAAAPAATADVGARRRRLHGHGRLGGRHGDRRVHRRTARRAARARPGVGRRVGTAGRRAVAPAARARRAASGRTTAGGPDGRRSAGWTA